jgi:hypothetical protein
VQPRRDEVAEDPLGPVTDHRTTDRLGDDEADANWEVSVSVA